MKDENDKELPNKRSSDHGVERVGGLESNFAALQAFSDALTTSQEAMFRKINFEALEVFESQSAKILADIRIPELSITTPLVSEKLPEVAATAQIFEDKQRQMLQNFAAEMSVAPSVIKAYEDIQISTLSLLASSFQTPMVEALKAAVSNLEYANCLSITAEALKGSRIAGADVAFFKNSELFSEMRKELSLPKGFSTALKNLNGFAANQMSQSGDLYYSPERKAFSSNQTQLDSLASSTEINTVYVAKWIFEEIADEMFKESELIDFMTFLYETPTMAFDNPVGKKIYDLIEYLKNSDNEHKHGFDKEQYYHTRAREKESVPYVWDEMLRAPVGVTCAGRYNHPGRSHYYFSDTKDGAESEVKKHNSDKEIQTVCIKPIRDILLLDLSETMRRGKTFLKYLRFPLKEVNDKMPREYLMPCFVSDCCKRIGFEGIKYYGGAKYSNYVVWNDGLFKFVRTE